MRPEGFMGDLHPVIDPQKCIECHLCEKACPILSQPDGLRPEIAYASWAKDNKIHSTSASGGVASILTKFIINRNGLVYGCTSEGADIRHIRIDQEDEYRKIQGSKYVQSSIEDVYRRIKCDLADGREVMFVGTPCQAAALRKYLKKEYDNLLIVDLICHGVPSERLFMEHIRQIAGSVPVTTVKFRSEDGYCLNIISSGKSIYKNYAWKDRYSDAYFTAFLKSYTFRESCYHCRYASIKRISDLTIGDFWGLDKSVVEEYSLENGVSVILPNTEKGLSFLDKVSDLLELLPRPVEEAVAGNSQLRHPSHKTLTAKIFRLLMNKGVSLRKSLLISDIFFIPFYKLIDRIRR